MDIESDDCWNTIWRDEKQKRRYLSNWERW